MTELKEKSIYEKVKEALPPFQKKCWDIIATDLETNCDIELVKDLFNDPIIDILIINLLSISHKQTIIIGERSIEELALYTDSEPLVAAAGSSFVARIKPVTDAIAILVCDLRK